MVSSASVVVLCGGFGEKILASQPASSAAANPGPVFGNNGSQRCLPSFATLNQRKSADYLVRALEGIRRVQPLQASVFFVCNEVDRQLFETFFLETGLGLEDSNIISNGAKTPADWQGDVFDLQLALRTIGTSLPVMVISSSLTFLPGYNLQRILEHSITRSRDVIGFSYLSDADAALLGPDGHACVQPSETVPVPPLTALEPGSSADAGTAVAEKLLVLRPSTLESAVMQSTAPGLVELGAQLLARGPGQLYGIDLQFGRVRLESFACFDYADRLVQYFFQNVKPAYIRDEEFRPESEEHSVQNLMATLNKTYATVYDDVTKLLTTMAGFDQMYFNAGNPSDPKSTMKQYRLPSTFYMTQYRRQAADVMH